MICVCLCIRLSGEKVKVPRRPRSTGIKPAAAAAAAAPAAAAPAAAATAAAGDVSHMSESAAAPAPGSFGAAAAAAAAGLKEEQGALQDAADAAAAGGDDGVEVGVQQQQQKEKKQKLPRRQYLGARMQAARMGLARGGGRGGRGRKRKRPEVWGGVPADVLEEAVHGPNHPPADDADPAAAAAAAAVAEVGEVKPDLSVLIAHPAASEPAPAFDQQQQQQAVKKSRPSRSAAAGVAAAAIAAGAGASPRAAAAAAAVTGSADPSTLKAMMRSANCKAAVDRRWAKYRQMKASEGAPLQQQQQGSLQQQQLPQDATVQAGVPADAAAAAGVSVRGLVKQQRQRVLQLPQLSGREFSADIGVISNALLTVSDTMRLPQELLIGLSRQLVRALSAAGGGGEGGEGAVGQLHAAVKGWYARLCGAVLERNGAMVAQLVEDLGSEVLAAAG